jgi:phosphoribosylpyrophosphate synthetase
VIVDDILDTGATLLSACEKLPETGVQGIDIMVKHGLFAGERPEFSSKSRADSI